MTGTSAKIYGTICKSLCPFCSIHRSTTHSINVRPLFNCCKSNFKSVFLLDTYKAFKLLRWLKAFPGTTERPQLCNDKRFRLFNPINASESICNKLLSDSMLKWREMNIVSISNIWNVIE